MQLAQARGQDEKEQPRQQVARLLWDTSGRWVDVRKKNLPTGVENISLGEECLTLVKTAPVALFITSLEKPGLAVRAQLKLTSPFP